MKPRLLAITPPAGPLATTCVEVAADLGIALAVLLREPGTDPIEFLKPDARVGALLRAARAANMPVLCSCSPQDATRLASPVRDAGLCGLQLRGDPSASELLRARAAWPDGILGASVHGDPRELEADYLVFAPVFSPGTPGTVIKRPAGLEALAAWSSRHPRVYALGGVTPLTAGACAAAGAHGVAGISTFLGSADSVADTLRALAGVLTSAPDVPPRPRG